VDVNKPYPWPNWYKNAQNNKNKTNYNKGIVFQIKGALEITQMIHYIKI